MPSCSAKRIKRQELVHLSRQLAAFLRAGVPMLTALSIIEGDGDSPTVRKVVAQIAEDLRNGATLTEAFDAHPHDFPLGPDRKLPRDKIELAGLHRASVGVKALRGHRARRVEICNVHDFLRISRLGRGPEFPALCKAGPDRRRW